MKTLAMCLLLLSACSPSTTGTGGGTGSNGGGTGTGGGTSSAGGGAGTGGGSGTGGSSSAGGGTGTGGGSGAITADQATTNFATAYCNKLNTCTPFAIPYYWIDVPTCIARTKLNILPALGGLSGSGNSPTVVNNCVATLNAATCGQLRAGTAGCKPTGSKPAGSSCGASSQCQSGYCKYTSNSCGTCANRVATGGNCTDTSDCVDNNTCVNAICRARGNVGAACSMIAPCTDLAYCKNAVCTAVTTAVNGPCDPNDSDSCDFLSGLYCDDVSSTCKQMQFANAGQQCGTFTNGFVVCKGADTCNIVTGLTGTCIGAAADGAACNPQSNLNCHDPAACEGGTCKLYNPSSCP